jgi:hypothetical protein
MSPLAQKNFESLGWTIEQNSTLLNINGKELELTRDSFLSAADRPDRHRVIAIELYLFCFVMNNEILALA